MDHIAGSSVLLFAVRSFGKKAVRFTLKSAPDYLLKSGRKLRLFFSVQLGGIYGLMYDKIYFLPFRYHSGLLKDFICSPDGHGNDQSLCFGGKFQASVV